MQKAIKYLLLVGIRVRPRSTVTIHRRRLREAANVDGSQNRMAVRRLSDSQSHPGTITSDSLMHVIKCSYQTAETCLKFYLFTYSVSSCTLSAHQGGDSWLMEVYCESRHSAVVVVSTFPVYVTARDKKLNVILEVVAFQQSGVRRRTLTIFMG